MTPGTFTTDVIWGRPLHCVTILRLNGRQAKFIESRGTSMVHSMTAFARVESAGT